MLFLLVFAGAVGILGSPLVDASLEVVSEIQQVVAIVTCILVAGGILTHDMMASHP
jgi:hypothetical protein